MTEPDFERFALAKKNLDPSKEPSWYVDPYNSGKLLLSSIPIEFDYVTEEAIFLDGHCAAHARNSDLTFVLTHKPVIGFTGPLMRFDWNPFHTHSNGGKVKGPWRLELITTSHFHPFIENMRLGRKRMVRENLPIAFPVEEQVDTFRVALDFAGRFFNIVDMQRIPEPGWADRLI